MTDRDRGVPSDEGPVDPQMGLPIDDGALARVKLYHSLFGLPHDLFKEIVSKL